MGKLRRAEDFGRRAPSQVKAAPKLADRELVTQAWRAARKAAGERRCAVCGTTEGRIELDHIVERRDGGSNDPANLRWLCRKHHAVKTAQERARRTLGQR